MSSRLVSRVVQSSRIVRGTAIATAPNTTSILHTALPIARPAQSSRSFGAFHVPVGPKSNIDGVYRRPELPPVDGPLSEHDELMWPDAQAPEPTFDQFEETNRWEALGKLVGALLFLFVGVHGAVRLYGPEARQVVVPQEFPFDGLRLSEGGINGAPAKRE